jgi:hypothetical protein
VEYNEARGASHVLDVFPAAHRRAQRSGAERRRAPEADQNPVASLISVPFQANWDVGLGSREAIGTTLNIQPVAPFPLTRAWNLILRVNHAAGVTAD